MAKIAFLSRSPGLLNRGPGCPASLGNVPHSSIFSPTHLNFNYSIGAWGPPLLGAGFLHSILSPTDWTSCAPSYIMIWRPLFFLRALQFRTQFDPSTVKVISWYSSTGCTSYLHRCISYFDSLAGLNMLHVTLRISVFPKPFWCISQLRWSIAQFAEAMEYPECISAEGYDFPNECHGYDIKLSYGDVPVMLKLGGIGEYPFFSIGARYSLSWSGCLW